MRISDWSSDGCSSDLSGSIALGAGIALATFWQPSMRRRSSTWSADCDSSYAWLSTLTCVPSWYDDAARPLETGAMTVGRSGAACGTVVAEQSTAACANPGTTTRPSRSTQV